MAFLGSEKSAVATTASRSPGFTAPTEQAVAEGPG